MKVSLQNGRVRVPRKTPKRMAVRPLPAYPRPTRRGVPEPHLHPKAFGGDKGPLRSGSF